MLGISTAWRSKEVETGNELLQAINEIGIDCIELDFRVTPSLFDQLLPAITHGQCKVLSIHNYFPLPAEIPLDKASADAFSLSSLVQDEREKGIEYTIKTIRIAHELGAGGVVVHLGRVEMDFQKKYYHQLYDRGELRDTKGKTFLEEQRKLREINKQKHLDKLFDSLDKILREAEKLHIPIGIETRLHFHEIPNFEEIGLLLKKFSGSPIYYWHDIGHAAVQENLGFSHQKDFLETYSSSLLGIHIHDTKGYQDHLAPGKGAIDFPALLPFMKDGKRSIIKVIELHPKVSKEELLASIDYLNSLGL
jgi:sugar phosphate isomerase/epimerase